MELAWSSTLHIIKFTFDGKRAYGISNDSSHLWRRKHLDNCKKVDPEIDNRSVKDWRRRLFRGLVGHFKKETDVEMFSRIFPNAGGRIEHLQGYTILRYDVRMTYERTRLLSWSQSCHFTGCTKKINGTKNQNLWSGAATWVSITCLTCDTDHRPSNQEKPELSRTCKQCNFQKKMMGKQKLWWENTHTHTQRQTH